MSEVKYFETTIPLPFKKGERALVYCKATKEGETWNVCIVHTDSSTPFIMIQQGVTDNFFNGVTEINKSYYVQQLGWVGNMCS